MSRKKDQNRMTSFNYGYWEVSIEKHGRMKLPTALLKALPENERKNFWLAHGFGKHIMLWTSKAYEEQMDFLNSLDRNDLQVKRYRNAFLRNIASVECDAQDRFVIPKPLLDMYEIDKEVVLLLDNGKIEIWSHTEYHKQFAMSPTELEELNALIHSEKFQKPNQN